MFFVGGGSQLVGHVSLPRRCMKDFSKFIKNCSGYGTLTIFSSKYSERCKAGSYPKADPVQGTGLGVSCGVWFSCMISDHSMPSCKSFLRIERAQCLDRPEQVLLSLKKPDHFPPPFAKPCDAHVEKMPFMPKKLTIK